MLHFSQKIQTIEPSATLGITSKAKAMKQSGEDVVVLAAGEPDFDTPDIIKEAASKAIRDGFTKYTPTSGTISLKEAICGKFSADNALKYSPENIIVSNGAKHSLYNIFQAICDPGDEILIIHPYWLSYPEMVKLAGGVPKVIQTDAADGFKVSADQIERQIGPRTRALILNSPSNPAGAVYDKKDLERIAAACLRHDMIIISDEIYEKIIFDGKKHYSIASLGEDVKARTVVVNGTSKSFAMTGWRIGYLACDALLARHISTLQDHSTSNPCSISQVAAETALRNDLSAFIAEKCAEFQSRRDLVLKLLCNSPKVRPFEPRGAFYVFSDISSTGMRSMEFALRLLMEKKVAVIPGGPFGEDGYIRLSFATGKETIEKGISRINDFLKGI